MIVKDLISAQRSQSLVNVYQYNSEVFYTGYVYRLSDDGVVIRTFNSYGMSDGMVFIRLSNVYNVEFYSRDLFNIGSRIRLAKLNGLLEYTQQTPMKLMDDQDLVKQILGRSYVERQMVMLKVAGRNHYVEGGVDQLGERDFKFTAVNKFNFRRRQELEMPYHDVQIIEFQGKELTLLSQSAALLFGQSTAPWVQLVPAIIKQGLKQAAHDQRLVEIEAYQDQDYFYIGWVKAVNQKDVILEVVDMSGQFGGYVLTRLDSIQKLTIISDYLSLVSHCVKLNLQQKNFIQPVLNDDRAFDPTENLTSAILCQARAMRRLVRIRTMGTAHSTMGMPSVVKQNSVVFRPVNEDQTKLSSGYIIPLNNIQEIAFDYLGTFLVKKQLDIQKWRH